MPHRKSIQIGSYQGDYFLQLGGWKSILEALLARHLSPVGLKQRQPWRSMAMIDECLYLYNIDTIKL